MGGDCTPASTPVSMVEAHLRSRSAQRGGRRPRRPGYGPVRRGRRMTCGARTPRPRRDGRDRYVMAPKVLLHDHLDGGLRPATVLELADAIGWRLPGTDPAELQAWSPAVPTPATSFSTCDVRAHAGGDADRRGDRAGRRRGRRRPGRRRCRVRRGALRTRTAPGAGLCAAGRVRGRGRRAPPRRVRGGRSGAGHHGRRDVCAMRTGRPLARDRAHAGEPAGASRSWSRSTSPARETGFPPALHAEALEFAAGINGDPAITPANADLESMRGCVGRAPTGSVAAFACSVTSRSGPRRAGAEPARPGSSGIAGAPRDGADTVQVGGYYVRRFSMGKYRGERGGVGCSRGDRASCAGIDASSAHGDLAGRARSRNNCAADASLPASHTRDSVYGHRAFLLLATFRSALFVTW